tara:strand:+ start:239 stop:523 length:285 start_codon:yes stop_codon:yes gene_type:complete
MTTSSRKRVAAEQQQRTEEIVNFLGVLDVGYRLPSWEEIEAGTDLHADHLRHIGRCIVRLREQGYLRRDMDAVVVEIWLNDLADAIEAGSNATP